MSKYTQEVKNQAVEMALAGKHPKSIQTEIGPNPKALERYLKKAGICNTLKELKAILEKKGITQADSTNAQGKEEKVRTSKKERKKAQIEAAASAEDVDFLFEE